MNRTLWIALGPTVLVAGGYLFVLRAMGLQPPYGKLAGVATLLGIGFWWIGRRSGRPRNEDKELQG